jgi:hypothetical protein
MKRYEIYELQNTHQNVGLGMWANLRHLWKNMILALVKKKCKQMEYDIQRLQENR